MGTVVHKNSSTPGAVPTGLQQGQLAVNTADRVAFIADTSGNTVKVFDQYSKSEADAQFIPNGVLPVTRVGDTPYLPLDVKGDFKGSVVPTRVTYVLKEPDGSVVGLRPGYNGSTSGAFYFYSPTGRIDSEADFVYTDTAYAPNFLRNDGTAVEYVSYVSNCNQYGFLASIKSRLDNTWQRWYWIHTNGTLDPLFHSYVDVTATITTYNLLSLQYIKEAGGFWGTEGDKVRVTFFVDNLPVNWVNNPSPASTTLALKSVNCVDPITGSTAAQTQWMNYNTSNCSAIYKPLQPPGWTLLGLVFPQPSNILTGVKYAVYHQMADDGVTLSMWISYSIWNSYNQFGVYSTMIVRMRYNTVTNTVSWLMEGNNAENQAFPLVFNPTVYTQENTTSTGDPTSDDYKQNKYPLQYALCADGSQWHVSTPDSYNFIDNNTVLTSSYVYSYVYYAIQATSVSTSPYTNKLLSFANRPNFGKNKPAYNQILKPGVIMYPYDASILGKSLGFATFHSRYKIGVNSTSRVFGSSLIGNQVVCTLPDMTISRKLDFSATNNALSLPTTSSLRAATPGLSSVPELLEFSSAANTIIYANGDYRVMPYSSVTSSQYHTTGQTVQGAVIKVIDGSTYTYDASRGGSTGVAIMPQNANAQMAALVASYKAASTLGFGANATESQWCLHYIGDYTTYGLVLFQYIIQNVANGTEFGFGTLRLAKTGIQMNFSANPLTDVVSIIKTPVTGAFPGGYGLPFEPPTCGILQYTDGRFFVAACGTPQGVIGNTLIYTSSFEISASGSITRSLLRWKVDNQYYGCAAHVHPDFGVCGTTTRLDVSSARISMVSYPNGSAAGVAKTFASFDGQLGGTLAPADVWMLTVEAAQGFNLYLSQFRAFVNGRSYQIPTMTINLTSVVVDPSSKTFYVYLEAASDTVMNMVIQQATLAETFTRVYIGKIITGASSISSVDLQKITRLDLYRPSHDPYVGSAMPIPV